MCKHFCFRQTLCQLVFTPSSLPDGHEKRDKKLSNTFMVDDDPDVCASVLRPNYCYSLSFTNIEPEPGVWENVIKLYRKNASSENRRHGLNWWRIVNSLWAFLRVQRKEIMQGPGRRDTKLLNLLALRHSNAFSRGNKLFHNCHKSRCENAI